MHIALGNFFFDSQKCYGERDVTLSSLDLDRFFCYVTFTKKKNFRHSNDFCFSNISLSVCLIKYASVCGCFHFIRY